MPMIDVYAAGGTFPDSHALALLLELSCFESVGRDEDERRRHGAFLCRLVVPSMRWLLRRCSSIVFTAMASR